MSTAAVHQAESTITARPRRSRRSAAALLALLLFAVATAGCMGAEERTFLDRTNALRSSQGVRTLKEHDALTDKAEAWAQHMASTGRLEHSSLTVGLASVSWTALGENVGYSTPTANTLKTIHDRFVASAAHKANLVNAGYTHMGVGVAKDRSGRVWVAEVFAKI
ncbi:MAG: CAP domain-containing protein [Acidimicrobiales bacterium]